MMLRNEVKKKKGINAEVNEEQASGSQEENIKKKTGPELSRSK